MWSFLFTITKPFSTVCLVIPESVAVAPDLGRDEAQEYRRRIEERMLAATAKAEAWAGSLGGRRVAAAPAAIPAPHVAGVEIGDATTRERTEGQTHGPR